MKLIFATFFTALFVLGECKSQNLNDNLLYHNISYGIGSNQIKEENLIPKVHQGLMHYISYGFEIRSNSYNHFQFNFGYGTLKTEIENEALSINARLSFGYCHNFKILESANLCYYLGPQSSFTSSLAEYENWDEAHAYWGNYFSLGPSNVAFIKLDESKLLFLRLDLALLGLYTRPDYNRLYANEYWTFSNIMKIMNSHYHFGFWNNAFQMNASTEYRTPIFKEYNLSLSILIYYSQIQAEDGKPLKELIYKLGFGIWL